MYDSSDPRSALAAKTTVVTDGSFASADCAKFYEEPAQIQDENGKTWFVRSQNCAVAYSQVENGASFSHGPEQDEFVLLLPTVATTAQVVTREGRVEIEGYSLAFIPPGSSEITIAGSGPVVRLYTTRSPALCEQCVNAASYVTPHANVAELVSWPASKDAAKVHVYSLDVPDEPGRFGRIWRGTSIMVNFLASQTGPRDITKLSPHHHDDFEQISLALEGAFTHHLRWPWTTNLNNWRDDEHRYCASPSVMIIPPPAIHTSRGMLEGLNQLVDIFSPPRRDFSMQPGWVLNADDYPMPD